MDIKYFLGLDLGTGTVRAVQGALDLNTGELSIIGAAAGLSSGMRKGSVLDTEEAVSSVSAVLEQLERMTGHQNDFAAINLGGSHLDCSLSRGTVAVARPDGEITDSDVSRALDAARAVSMPANREILHILPRMFTVDGQTGIADPRGTKGIRLEVDTCLVHTSSSSLRNLQQLTTQAGLNNITFVANPLAAPEIVLSNKQKELGCALVDIGYSTTSVSIYEDGELLHLAVIPIGGSHVTNDLAIGLRCEIETAERVKKLHGHVFAATDTHTEIIDLNKINPEEQGRVEKREIARIIEARMEEIFERIRRELKAADRIGKLPAGVVLIGGGSLLANIIPFTKKELGLPASQGSIHEIHTIMDRVKDPYFATAIGLVKFALKQNQPKKAHFSHIFKRTHVIQLKRWVTSLLP